MNHKRASFSRPQTKSPNDHRSKKDDRGDLGKLQKSELEILKIVVEICDKNHLEYFLMGGTFLGAIRHQGFIPWDDDIDVSMPREDYEKFMEIADEQLPKTLIYKNFRKGNEDTIYFARVENPKIQIEDSSALVTRKRNVWIDIFPLDGMPSNPIVRKFHQFNLLYKRAALQYSNYSVIVNQNLPNRPLHERLLIKLGKVINFEKVYNTEKRLKKLDKCLRKYPYSKSKLVINFMGAYKFKEMFPISVYQDKKLYQFEDGKFYAPKDYDRVLSQMYGDYMKLPPEHQRNKHHSKVIEEK